MVGGWKIFGVFTRVPGFWPTPEIITQVFFMKNTGPRVARFVNSSRTEWFDRWSRQLGHKTQDSEFAEPFSTF